MVEPGIHGLGDGPWLAFTTAATVGYGDIVPHTTAGRVLAVLVVLLGLGVFIAGHSLCYALFVQTEERQIERELLHELAALLSKSATFKRIDQNPR